MVLAQEFKLLIHRRIAVMREGVQPLLPGAIRLEHDPEKWKPVFRKDHAQPIC
jgi:hypothetical protein